MGLISKFKSSFSTALGSVIAKGKASLAAISRTPLASKVIGNAKKLAPGAQKLGLKVLPATVIATNAKGLVQSIAQKKAFNPVTYPLQAAYNAIKKKTTSGGLISTPKVAQAKVTQAALSATQGPKRGSLAKVLTYAGIATGVAGAAYGAYKVYKSYKKKKRKSKKRKATKRRRTSRNRTYKKVGRRVTFMTKDGRRVSFTPKKKTSPYKFSGRKKRRGLRGLSKTEAKQIRRLIRRSERD